MNSPADGVAPQLQNHVHLLSSQQFPLLATVSVETAYRYLLNAPNVVKAQAAMSWAYVTPPRDGTLWLEWLPQDKTDNYPSDGFVWGDPEQTYTQEFNGYTIEIKVHLMGYKPGMENMFMHARSRYHFVAKNPSVNAPLPDPSLWMVHYHTADPSRMIPVNQVPFTAQMQQMIQYRRSLEMQGQLERREFMFHDRQNWPMLHLPNRAQAAPRMQPGWPQPGGPSGPPTKRARTHGPGSSGMPGVSEDTSIEDEENTSLGDFFDHLTQRDISVARYTQHHQWIEEVFSSPYASNQIVPPDLGLGLMGELKGLTDGILKPPTDGVLDETDDDADDKVKPPAKAREAPQLVTVSMEQVNEFSKRLEKHMEDGRAEIERMKAEHAAKMQDWKKQTYMANAERRLRYANWEGHDTSVLAHRLDISAANGHAETVASKETVEDVVKDIEKSLKVKVSSADHATRIARGGLQERKPVVEVAANNEQQKPQLEALSTSGPDTVAAPQGTYHEDPIATTQTANGQASSNALAQPSQTTGGDFQQDQQADNGTASDALPEMDIGDIMDMDVDDTNINFDDPGTEDQIGAMPPSAANTSGATGTGEVTGADSMADQGGDDGLFNDDAFGDLTNIGGGEGDDGLIDFDGGGMGMDDSAFGDALHGMDAPEGEDAGNTPAAS